MSAPESKPERPLLRLVRGTPDDHELAALTAVVAGLASAAAEAAPEPERRSAWADRTRLVRRPLAHGPGAWKASGFPS